MLLDLSAQAKRDIERLHQDGAKKFGPVQAASYTGGLLDLLDLIQSNPMMARERPEFRRQMRLIRYRSHVVFYRVETDIIHVLRILHGKQDWMEHI